MASGVGQRNQPVTHPMVWPWLTSNRTVLGGGNMAMKHFVLAAFAVVLAGCANSGGADPQQLVDRATLAAQDMLNDRNGTDAQAVLRRARAAIICPRVLRAGFVFGGEGGACVLVARAGGGSWTAPAFYALGGASFGFQAGVQDAEVMLLIMNDRGLNAVLDSQFTLGADATGTFVELGGGIEGATTAALRADIVGFTRSRGLYAGISLNGSLLSAQSELNRAYYGRPIGAQQIVVGVEVSNPGADPLREVLTRYGAQAGGPPVASRPALPAPTSAYAPDQASPGAGGLTPVQQQALPPLRR